MVYKICAHHLLCNMNVLILSLKFESYYRHVYFQLYIHMINYVFIFLFIFKLKLVMIRLMIPPTLAFSDTHGRLNDDSRNSSLPFQVHQPNWSSDFVVFQHDARRNTRRSVFFAGVCIRMSDDDGRGWHERHSLCPLMPYVSLALNVFAAHPQALLVSQVFDCLT